MAKRKSFYASNKAKDLKDFREAIEGLEQLYSEAGKGNKKQLAKKFDISPSTLNRWIKGESLPSDENFAKLKNSYRAYKPTIKNENKKKKFVEKLKKTIKKEAEEEKRKKLQYMDANKWLDLYFEKRYHEAKLWEYFRMLIDEKGLTLVGYYLENPKEGVFLTSRKQNIIKSTFMHMIGITHNYPYEMADNQVFIRRIPRIATGLREKPKSINDFHKVRSIFYSGENMDKIENFIGYYFDSIE